MKNNLIVKIAFAVALSLGFYVTVMGQKTGFAGQDQTVMLDGNDRKDVYLGVEEGDAACKDCENFYHWRIVEHPEDDPGEIDYITIAKPKLTVRSNGLYVCECTRISIYGYQTETVYVEVCDELDIERAEMAEDIECFPLDGTVDINDLKIVTIPEGYQERVELAPGSTVAKVSNLFPGVRNNEKVYFRAKHSDGSYFEPEHNVGSILVIDNSRTIFSGEVPAGVTLISRLKDFDDLIKGVNRGMTNNEWLSELKKAKKGFWSLDMNFVPAMSIDCCNHEKKHVFVCDVSLAFEAGLHQLFPLPPFPNIGIDVGIAGEGSLNVLGLRLGEGICSESSAPATFSLSGTVFGKLVLSLVPGSDVVSVSGGLAGNVTGTIDLKDASAGFKEAKVKVSFVAEVVAVVSLFSINQVIVEKNL